MTLPGRPVRRRPTDFRLAGRRRSSRVPGEERGTRDVIRPVSVEARACCNGGVASARYERSGTRRESPWSCATGSVVAGDGTVLRAATRIRSHVPSAARIRRHQRLDRVPHRISDHQSRREPPVARLSGRLGSGDGSRPGRQGRAIRDDGAARTLRRTGSCASKPHSAPQCRRSESRCRRRTVLPLFCTPVHRSWVRRGCHPAF